MQKKAKKPCACGHGTRTTDQVCCRACWRHLPAWLRHALSRFSWKKRGSAEHVTLMRETLILCRIRVSPVQYHAIDDVEAALNDEPSAAIRIVGSPVSEDEVGLRLVYVHAKRRVFIGTTLGRDSISAYQLSAPADTPPEQFQAMAQALHLIAKHAIQQA